MKGQRVSVLGSLIREVNAKRYVEVGCKQGRLLRDLANTFPSLLVVGVDTFAAVPNSRETYEGWNFAEIEAEFDRNIAPFGNRAVKMKMLSVDAARRLSKPANAFEVIFIDAAHDYANVDADIKAWLPLVRPDGYLSGHDYSEHFDGVRRAVQENFGNRFQVHDDSVWAVRC